MPLSPQPVLRLRDRAEAHETRVAIIRTASHALIDPQLPLHLTITLRQKARLHKSNYALAAHSTLSSSSRSEKEIGMLPIRPA